MESNQNVYFSKPVKELIISGESPIPLEVIPNYMGINLVSVKSIEWSRQKDGQLIDLKINFNPNNKEICDCGKMAEWCYMPGYSSGESPYSCDDCVTSVDYDGCSCNWHYLKYEQPKGIEGKDFRFIISEDITKEDGIWIHLDEKGRPYPCAEYSYDKEGFDKD